MSEDRLHQLLLAWQEQRLRSKDVPAADLCRDCPELAEELGRHIRALRPIDFLVPTVGAPVSRASDELATVPPPAEAGTGGDAETVPPGAGRRADNPATMSSDEVPAGGPPPGFPGYEVVGKLGSGTFGVVYQARDLRLRRTVALKMIRAGVHADAQEVARFRLEAEAVARLRHPNIVQIYEVGEHDGLPYLALEFIAGSNLAEQLDGTPLPARAAAGLMETLARAMHHAHQQGVIHRDLKPGNILLQKETTNHTKDTNQIQEASTVTPGTPAPAPAISGSRLSCDAWLSSVAKITDFGLAKQLDRATLQTQSEAIMGTPSYMAPEQASKVRDIGPAADVYALGAILYELLTGRPPFRAETPLDTVLLVLSEEPVPPRFLQPKVARELETICLKCLEKDPGKRYASALALAEDLRRFQAGEPITARPISWWGRGVKWAKRRPAVAALASALVLLLVLGAAAAWVFEGQRRERQAERDRQEAERDRQEAERDRRETANIAAVHLARKEAQLLLGQARAADLGDPDRYREARAAVRRADELARSGPAPDALRQQVRSLVGEVDNELQASQRDRRLLGRLLEASNPQETPRFRRDQRGGVVRLARPDADTRYARAFGDWGLDVDRTPTAEAARRLRARPGRVVLEVAAALDLWAAERRRRGRPEADSRRLVDLARAIDPDPRRDKLRAVPAGGQLAKGRLRQLARDTDVAREPVLGVLLVARALEEAGERAEAVRVLRAAVWAQPAEVLLCYELGQVLEREAEPPWPQVVGYYLAARAARPKLGRRPALALEQAGQTEESLALWRQLVRQEPDNLWHRLELGVALGQKGDLDGAVAAYREVVALDNGFVPAHYNLGVALSARRDLPGAIAAYRRAIDLDPEFALAHTNLGLALYESGDEDGALACYRRAIELDPRAALPHLNLGNALYARRDVRDAADTSRHALTLNPLGSLWPVRKHAVVRNSFGGRAGAARGSRKRPNERGAAPKPSVRPPGFHSKSGEWVSSSPRSYEKAWPPMREFLYPPTAGRLPSAPKVSGPTRAADAGLRRP